MTLRALCAALLVALLGVGATAGDATIRVEVESEFGAESAWMEPFVAAASKTLVEMMANPDVAPPAVVKVKLKKDPAAGGVAGWSSPDGVGFTSNVWPEDKFRLWIVAHELANQFAHRYAGSGGFPGDWWSDGRSPFPMYAASLVLHATGHEEAAKWCREVHADQPDQKLFFKLHDKYGFALFAKFLRLLHDDRVDLGAIGAAWPAPDRVRSGYAIAYLSAAAGTNLAPLAREHGIGREPADWKQRHPEIAFVEYEATSADVDAVLASRDVLFGKNADARLDGLRDAFRRGAAVRAATQTAPTSSPIAFTVTSGFGSESDWTKPFLEKAAQILVARLGGEDRAPPAKIDVRLDLDAKLGGIGGGPEGASLHYVSNCWPRERFRLWIAMRDLARLLVAHYGGGAETTLWKPDALGDVLAVLALRELGEKETADWVEKATTDDAHATPRRLATACGWPLFAKFLRLLRDDEIDLAKIGEDRRADYAAAYLSIAAGRFLRVELGGGGARVELLMKRRDELFAHDAPAGPRNKFRAGDY